MRDFLIYCLFLVIGFGLIAGGGLIGLEIGRKEGRENCYANIESVVKAKMPIPSDYQKHDICYYAQSQIRCSVAYLNSESIIIDGQVIAYQPDGTWFYQNDILQVSVCRNECETK